MNADAQAGANVTEPWLSCRHISKRYGGVRALDDVDLDVYAGEVLGVVGPNGAGKSTLVKVIAAIVQRDEGSIVLDGDETDFRDPADAQRRGLVMMPQELTVLPNSTLVDNVTLGTEAVRRGLRSPRECRGRAERALSAVGLDLDPSAVASTLSAAQQRLLMLARALDANARLLVLDEPTAGLPPEEAQVVTRAVSGLHSHRITVVYVSHHLSEIATLCDRVICVREGRIAKALSGDEVTKEALVSLLMDAPTANGTVAPSTQPRTSTTAPGTNASSVALENVSGARLRSLSMYAYPGQVLGVTGLLGSGVAELVSYVVGTSKPETGVVRLDGETVSFASPADALDRGAIGYLAGDRSRSGFMALPIRENVSVTALQRWFGRLGVLRRRTERNGVTRSLATLSVKGDIDRPLGALSGGNQQRALVARLIAADVQVLVLDEPTIGVDIRARRELWDAVRRLALDRTVIVASSEPEELVAISDRVLCIRDGAVACVLDGTDITERAITPAIT